MLSDEQRHTRKLKTRVSVPVIVMTTCCIMAIAACVFFYLKYQESQAGDTANAKIVEKVSKAIELPNETPMVVTVVNKSQLTNKQLASKVNDGDVLMLQDCFSLSHSVYAVGILQV